MSLKRPKYHQSEIQTFLKCGKMWEFRYLRGLKVPPRAAMTVGSAVDSAVTENLTQKVKSGQDEPIEKILDAFSTKFDSLTHETVWDEEEKPGDAKDQGVQLVKVHHEQIAPRIDPKTVQENFVIETDAGYDLGGTIDLTEKSGVVADTKTAKSAYDLDAISRAIQPAMYDFAYEAINSKPAEAFRFDVLIKPTKKLPARIQQIQAKVTDDDRAWLFDAISQVHKSIQAGVALPAPEGAWWCSKDWCGYWSMCKGKKK